MFRVETIYNNGSKGEFRSISAAFEDARRNKEVRQITWTSPATGERVKFTRIATTRSTILWKYEPNQIVEI